MFKIYNLFIFEIHIVCIFQPKEKNTHTSKKAKARNQGKPGEKKWAWGSRARLSRLSASFLTAWRKHSANENNVLLSQRVDVIDFFLDGSKGPGCLCSENARFKVIFSPLAAQRIAGRSKQPHPQNFFLNLLIEHRKKLASPLLAIKVA